MNFKRPGMPRGPYANISCPRLHFSVFGAGSNFGQSQSVHFRLIGRCAFSRYPHTHATMPCNFAQSVSLSKLIPTGDSIGTRTIDARDPGAHEYKTIFERFHKTQIPNKKNKRLLEGKPLVSFQTEGAYS